MQLRTIAGGVVGLCVLLSVPAASAQTWGRPRVPNAGVCFYEDRHFEGRYFCAAAGSSVERVPSGTNDRISSIRIFGSAEVTVYRDEEFDGKSVQFTSDMGDLRQAGWNDRISSFRVGSRGFGGGFGRGGGFGGGSEWNWGRPAVPASGVCFYKDRNFGGDYFCARAGATVPQVPSGTNDKISSIRLFGNADVTVFRDVDFDGGTMRIDNDMRDLRQAGWNDRISSFRVGARGLSRGGNAGRGNWGGSSPVTVRQAENIVRQAYLSVFEREPDPDARPWVNEVIKNSWSQGQLEEALRRTPEYRNRQRDR